MSIIYIEKMQHILVFELITAGSVCNVALSVKPLSKDANDSYVLP